MRNEFQRFKCEISSLPSWEICNLQPGCRTRAAGSSAKGSPRAYPEQDLSADCRSAETDDAEVWHIGASLKGLGKKMSAFSGLGIPALAVAGLVSKYS